GVYFNFVIGIVSQNIDSPTNPVRFKTYKPFIIESVSAPIVAPIDEKGNRLSLAVNISLMSRTAWDSKDIYSLYGGN
ncbi:hypothetical protein RJC95_16715, partial [Acinetobacter baumannii]|nr:hypothetical protein [Acinetobacter baumannii]